MDGTTPAKAYNDMYASNERDCDCRLHDAWLGHLSGTAEGPLGKQVEERVLAHKNGTAGPTNRLETAPLLERLGILLSQLSRLGMRAGVIIVALIGFIVAAALTAVVIPQHLWLSESPRQALVAQPSRGISGDPAPLGLALRGSADDALVIVRGLMPGSELSAGRALTDDAWQLSARDLPYAWIAPPPGFVGSAELVAELHLPNSEIIDRQSIHVEWTRPAANTAPEGDPEKIGREGESVPPIAPAPAQDVDAREVIDAAPPMMVRPSNGAKQEKESKSAGAHENKNSRGVARERNRPHPFESLTVGDGTHSPKGFWDWSR